MGWLLFNPMYGQLIPFKRDENMWVYLAKDILNFSDFCLAGGTYVEQSFTSCLVGVCTPLESLQIHTVFDHKKINCKLGRFTIKNFVPQKHC